MLSDTLKEISTSFIPSNFYTGQLQFCSLDSRIIFFGFFRSAFLFFDATLTFGIVTFSQCGRENGWISLRNPFFQGPVLFITSIIIDFTIILLLLLLLLLLLILVLLYL